MEQAVGSQKGSLIRQTQIPNGSRWLTLGRCFLMAKCAVADCNKPVKTAGYCAVHYMRLLRYGRLNLVRRQNGTGNINKAGYLDNNFGGVRQYAHIQVAEAALGKPLPKSARVHHINGMRTDNQPSNLVICPSEAYHQLLHARMRARDACGHPDWRRCFMCGEYDALENLDSRNVHLACRREQYRQKTR